MISPTTYPPLKSEAADAQIRDVKVQLAVIQSLLHQIDPTQADTLSLSQESDEYIYVKAKYKRQKIYFNDIVWIESKRNYVSISTKRDQIVTMMPISAIERQLPENRFVRVHKSFIVALRKVNYTQKGEIGVEWDSAIKLIPLGAQYKKNFLTVIEQSTAKKGKIHNPTRPES